MAHENPVYLTKFEEGQKVDFQTFLQESVKNAVIKFALNSSPETIPHFEHSLRVIVSGLLYPHFEKYNVIYTPKDVENPDDGFKFDITVHYEDHENKVRSWDFIFDFSTTE